MDRGDALAIQVNAVAHPDFPLPLSGGIVRVACLEKEEYISSAAFSDAGTPLDVWSQPYGLGMALQLLTMHKLPLWTPRASPDIVGRWWPNKGILTGFRGVAAYTSDDSGDELYDWDKIGRSCRDISKLYLRFLDAGQYHFRRPWPATFRRMVYAQRTPITDDFNWLTIDDLWALREQCKRMRAGTWTRMRQWLRRQQLPDALRRALGGRVGRLLQNQRRTKGSREYRGVRFTRKKGGRHATTGDED